MKEYTRFEILISVIEKVLAEFPYMTVEHNVKIPDRDGNKNQFDVLISTKTGERFGDFRIAIECKNWTSKSKKEQVGAFINKLESANISQGIIVNPSGFQSGAKKKANGSEKVSLYTLEDIDEDIVKSWLSDLPMKQLRLKRADSNIDYTIVTKNGQSMKALGQSEVTVRTQEDSIIIDLSEFVRNMSEAAFHEQANTLLRDAWRTNSKQLWEGTLPLFGDTIFSRRFKDPLPMVEINDGEQIEIAGIKLGVKVVIETVGPFEERFSNYGSIDSDNPIAGVYIGDFGKSQVIQVKNPKSDENESYVLVKETGEFFKLESVQK